MTSLPSKAQLDAFRKSKPGPLMLFYEYSFGTETEGDACTAALAHAAGLHGGELRWSGREEEVICGRIAHFQCAASLRFATREGAQAFVEGAQHRAALAFSTTVQVSVVAPQPAIVTLLSALFSRLMLVWPFDNTVEEGEEPGVDVSTTMPTSKTIAAVRGHPDQTSPVVMINWLKFREQANYLKGEPPSSGRAAYLAYGKVAMTATHSLGAKLLYASRYRMILVGNQGDPGIGLWDEFALMQYPGRQTFARMAQLRRYRAALHHREAGLAEYGQGLTISRPAPEFTWKR